jgi:hypothetical protein
MTVKFAPTLHIFQRHIIDNVILTNWNWLPFWLFKNFCNGYISVTNQRLRKCMQSKYPSVSLFTDHDQLTENLRLLVADSHIAICWFSFFYDQNSYIMWSSIFKTITIVRLQSTNRETLVQIDNYSLKAHWSWMSPKLFNTECVHASVDDRPARFLWTILIFSIFVVIDRQRNRSRLRSTPTGSSPL